MNLANQLTLFRILLAAMFVVTLSLPVRWTNSIALAIFVLAGISDWWDGFLARKRNMVSDFGALLDPMADKILVCAAFVMFVELDKTNPFKVPAWMVVLIVSREFTVTTLRLLAAVKGKVLSAGRGGKVKTVVQIGTIMLVLIGLSLETDWGMAEAAWVAYWGTLVYACMWVTVILTTYSGIAYFVENWKLLKESL